MTMTASVRVMSAEEIVARGGGSTPFLHLPVRETALAEREMRLRQLANGHPMGDFLRFVADIAHAQQALLSAHRTVPLPDAQALDRAARAGQPPLPAIDWPRDPVWREDLRALVAALRPKVPAAVLPTLDRLATLDDDALERQADSLLTGVMQGVDLAAAPLVAAALQVYWTHLVLATQAAHGEEGPAFGRIDDEGLCPACGSRPTSSVTRTAGEASGQRYLHCCLCATQWHMVRGKCSRCGSARRVAYESLEAAGSEPDEGAPVRLAAVQAETCDDCGHYLKLMHGDRDPFVDPVADDLATLTLDLLVSESGRERHGVNLMLLFGEPDPAATPPPDPGAS